MTSNAQQIEMWSGPSGRRWVKYLAETERAFGGLADLVLEALDARPLEQVLDVGCGAGGLIGGLSKAVGEGGRVLGIDASPVLLECAEKRAAQLANAAFICEDAAVFRPKRPLDALCSCLGLMFFADPVPAFRNLGQCLRPGGRLVFCCWQKSELNPWCTSPLEIAQQLATELPPKPAPKTPGTFSLASKALLEEILDAAGFGAIEIRSVHAPVPMGLGGVEGAVDFALRVGPAAGLTEKQAPATQAAIRDRLRELFANASDGEQVALPGAAWLVSATR